MEEFNKYRDQGKTVVLVTHDIYTAKKYCDRALLLRDGKIVKFGNAREVIAKYINENIEDEEYRMGSHQKEKSEKRSDKITERPKQNRKAEIKNVLLLDRHKKQKNVFEVGELIIIRVICDIQNELDNPVFGIIISASNGSPLFITNTRFKNITTGLIGKGKLIVDFEMANCFANGIYQITPAIANKDAKIFFDWKDNFKQFSVLNREYNSGGIVDLDHQIKFINPSRVKK